MASALRSGGECPFKFTRRWRTIAWSTERVARPVSIRRVIRPPGADWAPRAQFGQHNCHRVAAWSAAGALAGAIDGELGAGRRAARPLVQSAGCRGARRARNSTMHWHALASPASRHGWRAARGRSAGAASLWPRGSRTADAPAWTRRWAAARRRRRSSLVAVRGAATHPYCGVHVRRHARLDRRRARAPPSPLPPPGLGLYRCNRGGLIAG